MSEALDLTRRYFELSNARDFSGIAEILDEAATYSSDYVGVYLGAERILAMKRAFFGGFARLAWRVETMEETQPGVVRVTFNFSGVTVKGERVSRSCVEHVIVHEGKLRHVEVRGVEDEEAPTP